VITDIFMPEMDGVEVIRKLNRERPATKVIAISGDVIDWPARFGVATLLGAHDTLPKPFHLGDLLQLVRRQLA
jgi:CheY-like chemotaxis protein